MEEKNNVSLDEVLESREARAEHQYSLLKTYEGSLISFMVNIPGSVKLCSLSVELHKEGMMAILEQLHEENKSVLFYEVIEKKTGIEGYLVVDCKPLELKEIACSIEDTHELGRLFDIDVIERNGSPIKREQLTLKPRTCLLCNELSAVCGRLRRHSVEELVTRMQSMLDEYRKNQYI